MFCAARRFPDSTLGVVWGHPWGMTVGNVQAVRSRYGTLHLPWDLCFHRIMGICPNILCSHPIPDVRIANHQENMTSSEHQVPKLRKQADRDECMRIVLLRHGKPVIAGRKGLSALEFAEWLDEWERAGLCRRSLPGQETMAVATRCNSKWCSNLQRSICSIKRVCPEADFVASKLFRELELPHGPWHWPRLHSTAWSVIFRLLGFWGFAYQAESWQQAKRRAQVAAQRLADAAEAHQSVLLVGHFFMNRLIARRLVKDGWEGPTFPKGGHWAVSVYEKAPSLS